MKTLKIGMAGLDTSHVPEFARLLHDTSDEHHVPGGRIVAAFPGGSPDFEFSISRVAGFTSGLREKHGVEIVDSLEALRGKCDAVMLMSIDGRVHLDQFREVSAWEVPVFIDKPLTISVEEAREIGEIAIEKGVRVTSASALRFSESFQQARALAAADGIIGADFRGPMSLQDKCPGYFWYGVHTVEMLLATLGTGCREVLSVREGDHDVAVGRWESGRLGTIRGYRVGSTGFGGVIVGTKVCASFEANTGKKPLYATLLDRIIPFFHGNDEAVPLAEMVEVVAFLDAANRSLASRQWTAL